MQRQPMILSFVKSYRWKQQPTPPPMYQQPQPPIIYPRQHYVIRRLSIIKEELYRENRITKHLDNMCVIQNKKERMELVWTPNSHRDVSTNENNSQRNERDIYE